MFWKLMHKKHVCPAELGPKQRTGNIRCLILLDSVKTVDASKASSNISLWNFALEAVYVHCSCLNHQIIRLPKELLGVHSDVQENLLNFPFHWMFQMIEFDRLQLLVCMMVSNMARFLCTA